MSPRQKVRSNCSGSGLLNTLINTLPVEVHLPGYQFCGPGTKLKKRLSLGQTGINNLDAACRDHDIAYESSNLPEDREKADRELENRAWENFKSGDTGFSEKAASWVVTTGMKAKRKVGGGGCGFKNVVGVAKKAIKKSIKACPGTSNMTKLIKSGIAAAKKYTRGIKTTCRPPRVIKVPKTGGALALIPILSGLSALGTLTGGVANVIKVIRGITSKRSGGPAIQLGGGLYLRPYESAKSGGGYKIAKSTKKIVTVKKNKRKKTGAVKRNNKKN